LIIIGDKTYDAISSIIILEKVTIIL
jgi:hypothetical protein